MPPPPSPGEPSTRRSSAAIGDCRGVRRWSASWPSTGGCETGRRRSRSRSSRSWPGPTPIMRPQEPGRPALPKGVRGALRRHLGRDRLCAPQGRAWTAGGFVAIPLAGREARKTLIRCSRSRSSRSWPGPTPIMRPPESGSTVHSGPVWDRPASTGVRSTLVSSGLAVACRLKPGPGVMENFDLTRLNDHPGLVARVGAAMLLSFAYAFGVKKSARMTREQKSTRRNRDFVLMKSTFHHPSLRVKTVDLS